MKHFKFTGKIKVEFGVTLHQIKATKDLPNGVTKGTIGGWVEKQDNLRGNAWVSGNAQVSGHAWVYGNARVYGDARVSGNAWVYGKMEVSSLEAIIVLVIAMKYSVTVTKQFIAIGCQLFETKKALKLSKKEAEKLGLPKEYFEAYKGMIKNALKIIR